MKFQQKLMLWIFSLSVIPVVFFIILSLIQTNQIETNIKNEIILDKLVTIQTRITNWFDSLNNQLNIIDSNLLLKNEIINILDSNDEKEANDGITLLTNTQLNSKEYIINYFNQVIKNTSNNRTGRSISEFFVLDSYGQVVITTDSEEYPEGTTFKNASFFKYYQDSILQKKGSISGIFGPLTPEQSGKNKEEITFAATNRIIDEDGEFKGLIVAFTNYQKLNKIISVDLILGKNTLPYITYLFDEKERALTYPIKGNTSSIKIDNFINNKVLIKNRDVVVYPISDAINTSHKSFDRKVLSKPYTNCEGKLVVGGWFWVNMVSSRFGGVVEIPVNFIQSFSFSDLVFIISGVILLILLIISAFIISKNFVSPLVKANTYIKSIAEGLIPKRMKIKRKDEIGELLKSIEKLIEVLRSIIIKTNNISGEIIGSSKLIVEENEDLTKKSASTTNLVEKTVTSMEEMTEFIKENSESATKANEVQHKAIEIATTGREKVIKTMQSINNIDNFSKKISEIIEVMDNIAFQTNLLSLNAAVESARSGEHGKGFSVLSAEIRSLAQRSKKASKQISELIITTNEKVNEAVLFGNESTKIFYKILDEMQNVTKMIEEVAKRTQSQKEGIIKINQSVLDIDQLNQTNTNLVDKVNKQNKIMLKEIQELVKSIEYFKFESNSSESQLSLPKIDEEVESQGNKEKMKTEEAKEPIEETEDNEENKNVKHYGEDDDSIKIIDDDYFLDESENDTKDEKYVEKEDYEQANEDEETEDEEDTVEEFIIDDDVIEDLIQPINKDDKQE